jgi:hypothetical protein
MGYPDLFQHNPGQVSAWIFPPAVDVTFLAKWKDLYFKNNGTNTKHDLYFQLEAMKNRTDVGLDDFGHRENVVHVGDAIDVEWNTRGEFRSLTMECIVCSVGKGNGTEGGVYDACDGCKYPACFSSVASNTEVQPEAPT